MRRSRIDRKTAETDIRLALTIEGTGRCEVVTGCGFMDHMLQLFAAHGRFDLFVQCEGDVDVDYHHTIEDLGIALGQAFVDALGEKKGIRRYGNIVIPMDEALVLCAVDISGRGCLGFNVTMPQAKVGDMDTELIKEFFLAFVRNADVTVHFKEFAGENTHHIIEAMFKAFGRVMDKATEIDENRSEEIPSTKGVL